MSSEALHFPVSVRGQARPRDPVTRSGFSEAPRSSTQNLADLPDDRILVQLADGSQDALAILFRRHSRAVHNIAYRIVRDTAEAEDLVQEVFLFVFSKASLFDPARGTARSWLMQVAYHRAFDRRRHLTSRRFYAHLTLEEGNLLTEEPESGVTSFEEAIEAALGQATLRRLESVLSEVQKRVLHLRFLDGYTMEEIGEILAQSPGNIRNHYYRALERIRKEAFGSNGKTK